MQLPSTPEKIRFQLLYRNSIGGSLFYIVAIILLLITRDSPLTSLFGWFWLLGCTCLIAIRTALAVYEGRQYGQPSGYFIGCTVAITVAISSIAWFPTGTWEQGPIVFLFCFFLMTLGFSMVFHVMPFMVWLNNGIVLGTLTLYYLLQLDASSGVEGIHWMTMIFFPLLFVFNVSLTRQMFNSTNQTIQLFNKIQNSNEQIQQQSAELKALAEEKQCIAEKAEAASRSKSLFLANISHEIRTPLNTVIGFSQVLENDQAIPKHCLDNINRIHTSGQHLLLLINDVLDMSKIEANKLLLDSAPTYLRELLNTVCDLMRAQIEDKGITFDLSVDDNVPDYVQADSLKLRQVLLNLLSNALKFTSEGSISVTANYDSDTGLFTLGVKDSGKGIASDEQKNLFQPFVQSDDHKHEGGTGLGLSISRRIVELMDGEVDVESKIGKGSYFFIQIPFPVLKSPTNTLSERGSTPKVQKDSETDISAIRVLVVDDIDNNRLLLTTVLKQLGIVACEASDGQEAIDAWQESDHQLILMDKRMPNVDGFEAAKIIKQEAASKDLPNPVIITVSADALVDCSSASAYSEFVDGYIAKPFDIRDVNTRLKQMMIKIANEEINAAVLPR